MEKWKISAKNKLWLDNFREQLQKDFGRSVKQDETISELIKTVEMYRKMLE